MKTTRQQLIRVIVPTLGASAFVLTAYSATSMQSHLKNTVTIEKTVPVSTDLTQPDTQVTVNGSPVLLDTSGHGKVSTKNGASVEVSSNPTPSMTPAGSSKGASSNVNISITSGGQTTNTSSSADGSTQVRVFGGSSSHSSSYSNTSISNSGDNLVEINQSN